MTPSRDQNEHGSDRLGLEDHNNRALGKGQFTAPAARDARDQWVLRCDRSEAIAKLTPELLIADVASIMAHVEAAVRRESRDRRDGSRKCAAPSRQELTR